MKKSTRLLVFASLLAALTCVATMIIKIPSPYKGYLNLGDGVVLFAGYVLPSHFSFLAAAIGSGLADIFSGYAVYAPATFVIKGLTALTFCLLYKFLSKKISSVISMIVSGFFAETVMVLGYFIFEGFMYGFIASAVNILPNYIQGFAGIIISTALMKVFQRLKIKI